MFQATRKKALTQKKLLKEYVWHRQTATQLAERYGRSERWVRQQIDAASPSHSLLIPQETPVVCDMTFWGRGYGVCVFRSPALKKNLWWKESLFETPFVYAEGLHVLLGNGWAVTGAIVDGKRGIASVFDRLRIPVQYCQFHQMKTVTKYLTRKPKTDAARELRRLSLTIPHTTEKEFATALDAWHMRFELFLNERTQAPQTKRGWVFTHRRVRAAHRSLATNLRRLFTYQRYPALNLPNTTNSLDGMFSQIKNRLAVHRGLKRHRRYKIICEILGNSATQKFH